MSDFRYGALIVKAAVVAFGSGCHRLLLSFAKHLKVFCEEVSAPPQLLVIFIPVCDVIDANGNLANAMSR